MADDIVTQLRQRAAGAADDYLSYAAADEIEGLREDVEGLKNREAELLGYIEQLLEELHDSR